MNLGVAFFVVFFFLGGHVETDGGLAPSMEACQEQVNKLPKLIADYNASAENPVKITHYAADCAPLAKAPQGKKV
jgi:hypothetical protein